ncbi:IclR family transcriptional regulator [Streptomyces sp. NPDC091271]|uniref:IclR family transcriptional regulator n=1 Tax=Streptomyces sp. NPDC091271 TaxID=3365980 RepID=UPI003826D5DB
MAGNAARPGRSVTSRALAILGVFDERHRQLGLTDLAARAGLPAATAHRLVGELVTWGALSRTEAGTYVVGRRLWDIGLLAPVHTGLGQIASPYLHDLYGATGATVHLAVREGRRALYVDRLSGHASAPVVSAIGSRLPLHTTGVGKVLLAHAPADIQAAVLDDLPRVTPHTVTQPGRLRRQLEKVREDDFATTVEEMSLGARSAAVPIRAGGIVVAALGVVVPSLKRDRTRLVSALQVAARGIGRSIPGPVAG